MEVLPAKTDIRTSLKSITWRQQVIINVTHLMPFDVPFGVKLKFE
jgi:hypothetical protein